MQLRSLAPLAVIGAGLLAMSLATRSASADENGAPESVDVASIDGGLLVSWSAPSGSSAPSDYDVSVADSRGKQVLAREVDASSTSLRIGASDVGGLTDLTVVVAADYGSGAPVGSGSIRVALPSGPAKPAVAPSVRVAGRTLKVALPETPDGVTGRVVQLYRDGGAWATVSVGEGRALVNRKVAVGHTYAVAYQDVSAAAAGPLSDRSAEVDVRSSVGPGAVRTIKLLEADGGLQVRWSTAAPGASDPAQYRVTLVKDGQRVGSAMTAADVRSVVVPSAVVDGVYVVTVVAVDVDGRTSTSTASVTPRS